MSIIHRHGSVQYTCKPGDDLAGYAATAYGFVLNTPQRRRVSHDGPAFAAAISEVFDPSDGFTAILLHHLRHSA